MSQEVCLLNEFQFTVEQKCCIEKLKKLVEDSRDLCIGTEDAFLSRYLYFTDWNVMKAFDTINGYYDFKISYKNDWITNKCVEDFKDIILNTGARYLCPNLDKNGRYLCIFRLADAFDRYPNFIQDLVHLDDLILEALLATQRGQEFGISVIFDTRSLSKNYMNFLKPKHMLTIRKKNSIFPLKNRIIHVIQTGFLINMALSLVLPLVGALQEDAIFHKEVKTNKLTEMIGFENLPFEYGGPKENNLDSNVLYDFLTEHKDFIKKVQGYEKILIKTDK